MQTINLIKHFIKSNKNILIVSTVRNCSKYITKNINILREMKYLKILFLYDNYIANIDSLKKLIYLKNLNVNIDLREI